MFEVANENDKQWSIQH